MRKRRWPLGACPPHRPDSLRWGTTAGEPGDAVVWSSVEPRVAAWRRRTCVIARPPVGRARSTGEGGLPGHLAPCPALGSAPLGLATALRLAATLGPLSLYCLLRRRGRRRGGNRSRSQSRSRDRGRRGGGRGRHRRRGGRRRRRLVLLAHPRLLGRRRGVSLSDSTTQGEDGCRRRKQGRRAMLHRSSLGHCPRAWFAAARRAGRWAETTRCAGVPKLGRRKSGAIRGGDGAPCVASRTLAALLPRSEPADGRPSAPSGPGSRSA
jgi:hypothetical protein